jgi:putative ABC transport system substrate-binding protein
MRFNHLKRREFVTLLGGAAVAWPLVARAQQSAMPVIGFLSSGAPGPFAETTAAFSRSLSDAGYLAGRNVTIEFRWAEGQYDRLPALAGDLVRHRAAVIAVAGGAVSALAAKAATSTIPIVFMMGDDPVQIGLVASLNRPGGNVTGVSLFIRELMSKRFELLTELVPNAATIALLVNPANPNAATDVRDAQVAARGRGRQIVVLNASTTAEIDQAFASLVQQGAGALLIGTDIFFTNQRAQIVALASRYGVPTMHLWREYVVDGGLVSYGTSHTEPYRQAASYVARILKGEKPADLPVIQPTKFELVINLKTARALGLTVPLTLQVAADEVIE